jgi:hypothetical protein
VSIGDGTTYLSKRRPRRKQWDETFTSAAKRDTSPTAQVPKLFGPIYATASTWRRAVSPSLPDVSRPRRLQPAAAPWSRGIAHEAARGHQLGRGADHAHPVPRHVELTVVGLGGARDLEVVADATQRRVELQRDAAVAGVQPASDLKPLAVERRALGDEPDVRVLLGVEEVGRAQMRVALFVLGVEAVGFDGELDGRLGGEVERAVVAEKRPLTVASP